MRGSLIGNHCGLEHLQCVFQCGAVGLEYVCGLRVGDTTPEGRVVVHAVAQKQHGAGDAFVAKLGKDERVPALLHVGQGSLGELVIVLRQAAEGNEGTVERGVIRRGGIDVVGAGPSGACAMASKSSSARVTVRSTSASRSAFLEEKW